MDRERINKSEAELLIKAINKIITSEVLEKEISDNLPLKEELSDSNKVIFGKASILFVDIRESTKLSERFNQEQIIKIYRSYVRTVVQAIRYSGGVVRDFMGDGVLAVFIDNEDGSSENNAVRAGRYITTVIDKFLNPVLDKEINYRISCGIGIHTGEISISKVGMKGKEQSEGEESEYGIVWIGDSTNLACKFSNAVGNGTIFICSSTYSALSDIESKKNWHETEFSRNSNTLKGYSAKQYYLILDDEYESFPSNNTEANLSIVDEIKSLYDKHISEIEKRVKDLTEKELLLKEKEQEINNRESDLNKMNAKIDSRTNQLNSKEYEFYCNVLRSGHCKSNYVIEMKIDFWENALKAAINAGYRIGKTECEVKHEVSFAMVSIYKDLEIYDKAYDYMVYQAEGYSWLYLHTVIEIVTEVKYCDRIKTAIIARIEKGDLSNSDLLEFKKINDWLNNYSKAV